MDNRLARWHGRGKTTVSTKIGIIAEGPIDHVLLRALLSRIAEELACFTWPLDPGDIAEVFRIRKRGHGGVLRTVRALVKALNTEYFSHACFVILLDRRTRRVQAEVRRLIRGKDRFVLGVAIEEIEAWWLADRTNTLRWCRLEGKLPCTCRYAAQGYQAEQDDNPKKTLDELTACSDQFDRCYGSGNLDLASDFAERFWRSHAALREIATQCPKGYVPFQQQVVDRFRHIRDARGRLFR